MPTLSTDTATVDYQIRYSNRAKNLSVTVNWNGDCEVVVPRRGWLSDAAIERFLQSQARWIVRQVQKLKKNANKIPLAHRGIPTQKVTAQTWDFINQTLDQFAADFAFTGIKVRSYKSRWGSCDVAGRLCFHYKLSLLPGHLAQYIIIHELCHTRHLNHSKDFWALVGSLCPDYKLRRQELKKYLS